MHNKRNDVITMKHDIECVLNAIECARENARDENVELTTYQIYDVANSYINEQLITCECETRLNKTSKQYRARMIEKIERELRELYTQHIEIETRYIMNEMYHVVFSYIDYDTRVFSSMIVSTYDLTNSNFKNFIIIDEMHV
jgi:hypothetical protein